MKQPFFCEWGEQGIAALYELADVFVIVDVLSFSTCVDIAVSRGSTVYPYPYKDATASDFARSVNAICASIKRSHTEPSLSSYSLRSLSAGSKLVLPSPNGSHLSMLTQEKPTFCGSLRNARSVAQAAQTAGKKIAVIPAGERWEDGSIRFALEDQIGAGAIISELLGQMTAEAELAYNIFMLYSGRLEESLMDCVSGRELIERGFLEDVKLASELNVSTVAPSLINGAYADPTRIGPMYESE